MHRKSVPARKGEILKTKLPKRDRVPKRWVGEGGTDRRIDAVSESETAE